jgi:hypothetical protein
MGLIGLIRLIILIGLMGHIGLIRPMPKKRKGASHHVKLLFFFI